MSHEQTEPENEYLVLTACREVLSWCASVWTVIWSPSAAFRTADLERVEDGMGWVV